MFVNWPPICISNCGKELSTALVGDEEVEDDEEDTIPAMEAETLVEVGAGYLVL